MPGDVSGPIFAHSSAPISMIDGTLAIVQTLLICVGAS